MHERVAHAGLGGDVAHAHGREAALGEELLGGVQDGRRRLLSPAPAPVCSSPSMRVPPTDPRICLARLAVPYSIRRESPLPCGNLGFTPPRPPSRPARTRRHFAGTPARLTERTKEGPVSDTFAVVMAGYQGIEAAKKDFDALVQLVKDKKVKIEGVILVDARRGRQGHGRSRPATTSAARALGWGGGVGVLVGLAAPPLLASIVVGAAAGGLVGKFAEHKVEQRPRRQARRDAASPAPRPSSRCSTTTQRLAVEQALAGLAGEVGRRRRTRRACAALKDSLAEAMGKFDPDRTRAADPRPHLRRRRPAARSRTRSPTGR